MRNSYSSFPIIVLVLFAFTVLSCERFIVDNNEPKESVNKIDSIVVKQSNIIELSASDTLSLDIEVFPHSVNLSPSLLSNRQIFFT